MSTMISKTFFSIFNLFSFIILLFKTSKNRNTLLKKEIDVYIFNVKISSTKKKTKLLNTKS